MKALKLFATNLSIAVLAACCGLWLLLSAPGMGWQMLRVPTGSMRPAMPDGSLAIVRRVPISSLRVGDVITYVNPLNVRQTITHRIVSTYLIAGKVPGFVTKGDANTVSDIPIASGSVLGKVVWHAPHLGTALSWAKSWAGIAVLVYLPALIIMVQEFRRLSDYYRLSLPYYLARYRKRKVAVSPNFGVAKFAAAPIVGIFALVAGLIWQPLAAAQPLTNTVTLASNRLSRPRTGTACTSNNQTTISVTNTSTQTAISGSTSVSGSTNGGSTTSGNVSNSNSSNTIVSVTNTGC